MKKKKVKIELYEETAKKLLAFFKINFRKDIHNWDIVPMYLCEKHFKEEGEYLNNLKDEIASVNDKLGTKFKLNPSNHNSNIERLIDSKIKCVEDIKPFITFLSQKVGF